LCHHEFLRPIGACRLCQVEDEKRGVVMPACVTQIQQGMMIQTDSERVVRNRKNILRLLLAAHPESCVVCEKGNRCELRNLAARMGIGWNDLDRMPYLPVVQDLNPFLTRDLSKCIMCAKCLRADQDLVVEGVIDYTERGFDAHPSTLFKRPLEASQCTFCGTCLSVCPTAAIAEKDKYRLDHAGARTRSVCSFCACGCSIYLEHNNARVCGVSPTALKHTSNGVTLCVKGHFGHDYLNSPDRLVSPLQKTDDGFQPVSWDVAINVIARNFSAIRDAEGPGAIGFIGGGRSTNEENYLFQKLARTVIGCNNIDTVTSAGWNTAADVLKECAGFAAGSIRFSDLEEADVILIIGAHPAQTAPVLDYHIKRAAKKREADLIIIDPAEISLARFSAQWLKPKVGSDFNLLNALLKIIVDESLYDSKFVFSKTAGFDELSKYLTGVSLSESCAACGVDEKTAQAAARKFAQAGLGCVVFGSGVMNQPNSRDIISLLMDLSLLTGNIGKQGAGFIGLLKECNAQGARDMGVAPCALPGHLAIDDPKGRSVYEQVNGVAPPTGKGMNALEMMAGAADRIKAMYIFNENPVGVLPDRDYVDQALSKLQFLVVQDMFLTDTARHADIVLPAAGFAEKEGVVTNMERRVQRLHQGTPSPNDFPSDWRVISNIANALGNQWSYQTPEDILREIERAAPLYLGAPDTDLDAEAFFWPLPGLEEVFDTMPHGIGHSDGKARFLTPRETRTRAFPVSSDFPIILMQGHIREHLGTGTRSSKSKRLLKAKSSPALGVNPADMEKLGLSEGDRAKITSENGALEARVTGDSRLPEGLAFIPASFPEMRHTTLFGADWKKTDSLSYNKHCRVRIEKIEA